MKVAVVDSGWDRALGDERVLPGIGFVSDVDDLALAISDDDRDRLGHGTACADIILQVSPASQIVPFRVFGGRLETSPEILIAAIRHAIELDMPLLNVSLGTERADALEPVYRVCEEARKARMIIVAAAGKRKGRSFPAIFDPVIGVSSGRRAARFDIAYHAGAALECEAEGMQQARGLLGAVAMFGGSSFATPVVTGIVAEYLATLDGRPDIEDVRAMLRRTACNGAESETTSRPGWVK